MAPRQADERFQVLVAQRLDVREKGFLEDLPGRGILRNVFGEVTTFCLHTLDDGVGPRTQIRRVGPFVVQTLFEEIEHDARAALVRLKVVKDGLRVLLEIFKGTCTATHGRGGGSARREGSARPERQARRHAGREGAGTELTHGVHKAKQKQLWSTKVAVELGKSETESMRFLQAALFKAGPASGPFSNISNFFFGPPLWLIFVIFFSLLFFSCPLFSLGL